jgi:NTP pyrophosphatase (non-canonical NTP hydrolase)
MKLNEYVKWTGNTCAKLETPQLDDIHMIFGMITETGELTDAYKKNLAYGTPLDMVNVSEEIGDLMFYIASFCRMNKLDLEKILETNVAKLESRYPEKFSEYYANNRNLEKEREILEK